MERGFKLFVGSWLVLIVFVWSSFGYAKAAVPKSYFCEKCDSPRIEIMVNLDKARFKRVETSPVGKAEGVGRTGQLLLSSSGLFEGRYWEMRLAHPDEVVIEEPFHATEGVSKGKEVLASDILYDLTTLSGSSLQGIWSSPAIAIADPGGSSYINIISVSYTFQRSTAYNFMVGNVQVTTQNNRAIWDGPDYTIFDGTGSQTLAGNFVHPKDRVDYYDLAGSNDAVVVKWNGTSNASQGTGILKVRIYYTVETSEQ